MLYRGINKQEDEKNAGRLLPKGNLAEVTPKLDGQWTLDGRFKLGPCESNTARAHHIESGLYGGCGISTSRSKDVAIRFATSDYTEDGYLYTINEALLEGVGVSAHEFPDPLNPHEKEVTLIKDTGGPLPESVIIDKYAVGSDGRRI